VQQAALDHARRHSLLTLLLVVAGLLLAWAAFAPLSARDRNHVLEITAGTLQRRVAGDINGALPLKVRLTVGVRDVLHIKNNDVAPHYLGAITIKPGKQLHLPFEQAGVQEFTSSAHFGGKLTVAVEPWPDPGTARVRWRTLELIQAIRHY
jgi:hypothetical protein